MLSKAPDLHLHAMLNFISSIFQLWGESVSLVILFLCLGLAKMVFCSEGEPPVGVLHSDTEPSRASSVLRCFSKYDLGLTLPSVGHFVRKWITWIIVLQKRSIRRFVITEKATTRAFSWLKAPTSAFTFKTLLRQYAKRALTPRSLNVKLGPRHKSQKVV